MLPLQQPFAGSIKESPASASGPLEVLCCWAACPSYYDLLFVDNVAVLCWRIVWLAVYLGPTMPLACQPSHFTLLHIRQFLGGKDFLGVYENGNLGRGHYYHF